MTPEAREILEVFRLRGLRSGEFIPFTDFGHAIVWEGGFVRDEAVREALYFLTTNGYLLELNAGLELTEQGEREVFGSKPQPAFGARLYRIDDEIIAKQMVLRGVPAEYLIDERRERRVSMRDDAAIAAAVRDAVDGRL
jgi:hypothetical protein